MSIGVMLFCPFTGKPRHPSDIQSDPKGILVWDGEEPLRAYSPPAQRKPLTDEEIYKLCRNEGDETNLAYIFNKEGTWSVLTLARAIEAAHNIKENT